MRGVLSLGRAQGACAVQMHSGLGGCAAAPLARLPQARVGRRWGLCAGQGCARHVRLCRLACTCLPQTSVHSCVACAVCERSSGCKALLKTSERLSVATARSEAIFHIPTLHISLAVCEDGSCISFADCPDWWLCATNQGTVSWELRKPSTLWGKERKYGESGGLARALHRMPALSASCR